MSKPCHFIVAINGAARCAVCNHTWSDIAHVECPQKHTAQDIATRASLDEKRVLLRRRLPHVVLGVLWAVGVSLLTLWGALLVFGAITYLAQLTFDVFIAAVKGVFSASP